jgi:hypothetical protein
LYTLYLSIYLALVVVDILFVK